MSRRPVLDVLLFDGTPAGRWAWRAALVMLAYYLGGRLGLAIPQVGSHASLFWPSSGIALAALLRWGPGMAPAIAVAALAVNSDGPLVVAALIAAGNTVAPLAAARLLSGAGFRVSLERRRDLALLAGIGALGATLISATNGVSWLAVSALLSPAEIPSAWLVWWLGDALGVIVVGVPLLTLPRVPWRGMLRDRHAAVTSLLAVTVMAAAAVTFVSDSDSLASPSPWMFAPHLLLAWLAARSRIFVVSATTLAVALIAAIATSHDLGPFARDQASTGLLMLWGYLCTLAATGLGITAATAEIAANEHRWILALDGANLGVADWDLRSGRGIRSRRWLQLLGLAADDPADHLDDWLAHLHVDDANMLRAALVALRAGRRDSARFDVRMPAGTSTGWFACHAIAADRTHAGVPQRLITTLTDISEQRAAGERQRLSAHLFQNLHEGLLITDAQYRVLDVNPTFCAITGTSRESMIGIVPDLLNPASEGSPVNAQRAAMWASLREGGAWRGELVERRHNGDPCALRVTISTVRSADGSPKYLALAISDITEQRLQREQLERQAHFDELTRLPNRARLSHLLHEAMAASDRDGFLLTVCYIDLDHFKPVNDRFGHAGGDRLLVDLGARLRNALRSGANWGDAVARLGGDEFVLLLRTGSLDESRQAVERILRLISQPYVIDTGSEPVEVCASIGATVYPLDRSDAETLLRHADHAMYGAKQGGRNGYLFFDPEQSRRTQARVVAVGQVQDAFEQGELALYFQPKVDMRTGAVLGVEALLRWLHPEHGVIGPANFLPLIEHTPLGARVGDWVLECGIAQLAHWLASGLDLSVSINVSARHLQAPDFAARLAELLARHDRAVAQHLELEVLETVALADITYTCDLMERCRALGVRFALDDFGTGYSNLTYLKRLPVDVLKIDRSFVHGMLTDSADMAIVEGVIGLARTFDCTVIAEGVESAEQARRLVAAGCDVGQGLGIAAPMPAADVFAWAREHRGILAGPRAVVL